MTQINELFSNNQVDLTGLPETDHLNMIPLEPVYKKVRYISASIFSLGMIIAAWAIALTQPEFYPFSYIGAGLISIFAISMVLYNGHAYHFMGYAIREKDITYKSGWLWKSMVTVPFNRVQHCDLRQGILDRRFGLSKLTIYTAGGQSTDLMIPGLLPDTAEKLKTFILASTEQSIETE